MVCTVPLTACSQEEYTYIQTEAAVQQYDSESDYSDADQWQFTSDNYWVCAKLKDHSAKTRYADGTPVHTGNAYDVIDTMTSEQCGWGWIRLDHREILEVRDSSGTTVRRLVWHKGGQDYESPKPAYGWIDLEDILYFDGTLDVPTADNVPHREGGAVKAKGMAPIGAPLVQGTDSFENGVPFWNNLEDEWDASFKLGKACEAEPQSYHYKVIATEDHNGIPITWQYKKNRSSSRYNKYADGGADYGDGTAKYAWLMWNFLTTADGETKLGGGGMMRGLVKNGQEFYRCKVKAIRAKAWAYMGTEQVGEITAWYIKTRGNTHSPYLYGWLITEHRGINSDGSFGNSVLHYE